MRGEAAWETANGVEPDAFMQRVATHDIGAALAAQASPPLPLALPPPPQQQAPAVRQEEWFANLEKLMDWRRRGFLNDVEFEAAKQRMGLSPGQ